MKIQHALLNISQLLGSNNEQFVIPPYQRRYSWGKKQVEDLLEDFYSLTSGDRHLLGNIVCLAHRQNSHTGIYPLELVDGQQRITTISIFLKAFQKRCLELEEKDIVAEINSFIFCKNYERKNLNKLVSGDLDKRDYIRLMNGELTEITNLNLLTAYDVIYKRLQSSKKEIIYKLYAKFLSDLVIVKLTVEKAKNAYKLFEVINNRGLKLSPTDIIKNFLLGHASSENDETLKLVRANWTKLIVCLDGISTDTFFRQYMCSVLGKKITNSKLIDEFKTNYFRSVGAKSIVESKIISDFSHKLQEIAKTYSLISNEEHINVKVNRHLTYLNRIESLPSYIFLINLFSRSNVNDYTKIEVMKVIETFMMRRHICESRTGELDMIFSKLVTLPNINLVENMKNKLASDLPSDDYFEKKFTDYSFKKVARAKYVLEMLEYNLIKSRDEYTLNSGNDLHLEHIIPQKIKSKRMKNNFEGWVDYLGEDSLERHKEYVHRIGNLTLLSRELNIIANNNPFNSKKEEYKNSNIQITKELLTFKQFKFDNVEERSKELAKKAVKIWAF